MALLGSFIDVRTIASIASNGSASFAHGLPASPDFVFVQATEIGSGTAQAGDWAVAFDATNVSVSAKQVATPIARVISMVGHSIIR